VSRRIYRGRLHWIEWRLTVDADLGVESPDLPRPRRLRAAVLEYLSEPCELPTGEASA
jgi:hypothetical protein